MMDLSWFSLLFLSLSWIGASGVYGEAPGFAVYVPLAAAAAILVFRSGTRGGSRSSNLRRRAVSGLTACAAILLVQALVFPFARWFFSWRHAESLFAALSGRLLSLFGPASVAEGNLLYFDSALKTVVFASTWEKVGALFFATSVAGGFTLLALKSAGAKKYLLLFGTYKSPRAAKALFNHFGFSFENIPIGRVAPEAAPEMALWNACPLLYEGRPATATFAGEVESLVDVWGYSVAARRSFGNGFVYAFADGDFIKNKNLENISTYRKGNVDFVAGLLEAASGRAPAGGPPADANAGKEAGE
jgi:hypothetical protein